jgi:CRP-like cAMP-binding protein
LAAAIMLVSIFANLLITPIIMVRWRLVGLHQIYGMHVDPRVFKQSPLLLGMSGYQRRKAILISELHDFDAQEVLIQQGEFKRSMYMLLEGEVDVIQTENGVQKRLARLGPGEIFGEFGYMQAVKRGAMVRAVDHVAALRFDHDKMQSDLRYFPRIAAKLHDNISRVLKDRADLNDSFAADQA